MNYLERVLKRIEDINVYMINDINDMDSSYFQVGEDLQIFEYSVYFKGVKVPLDSNGRDTVYGAVSKKYSDFKEKLDLKTLEDL
jgi:hypothetical protein